MTETQFVATMRALLDQWLETTNPSERARIQQQIADAIRANAQGPERFDARMAQAGGRDE